MKQSLKLRFWFNVGFAIVVAAICFDFYLAGTAPHQPTASTGQTVRMKVRGGHVFVRSYEYYTDRIGIFAGAALALAALGASALERRRA